MSEHESAMNSLESRPVPSERISLPRLLLYLLGAGLLVFACGGAVVLGKRSLFGPAPTVAEGEAWPISIWLVYVALACAVLVAYGLQARFVERRRRIELATGPALPELLGGGAMGIGLGLLIVLVLAATGCYRIAGWHGPADLAAPTLMALGAALMEEVLVRGFILGLVERWAGSLVALVLSAVLFGAAHLDNDGAGLWPVAALTLGAGMALGAAYLATGRLWLPIGLHFGWNFAQSGLFDLPDSGTKFPSLIDAEITGPDWLTGATFGPEASLPGLAIWVLLGLVLLVCAVRRGRLVPWRTPAV
jgi:membrane protease YdiL (CAAX protease family)